MNEWNELQCTRHCWFMHESTTLPIECLVIAAKVKDTAPDASAFFFLILLSLLLDFISKMRAIFIKCEKINSNLNSTFWSNITNTFSDERVKLATHENCKKTNEIDHRSDKKSKLRQIIRSVLVCTFSILQRNYAVLAAIECQRIESLHVYEFRIGVKCVLFFASCAHRSFTSNVLEANYGCFVFLVFFRYIPVLPVIFLVSIDYMIHITQQRTATIDKKEVTELNVNISSIHAVSLIESTQMESEKINKQWTMYRMKCSCIPHRVFIFVH